MTLPPALSDLPLRPVSGIRPFDELPIDAAIWEEAHSYHTTHRRLHLLGNHRPGIVSGLEVTLSATAQNRVTVAPGVGIDRQGNLLLLPEPVSLLMEEQGMLYILLTYQALADRNSAVSAGGGEQYYRVIEGRDVRATRDLPKTPYLELGRIYRTKADEPARPPKDSYDPGSNELNLLHRLPAFPACVADGGVGELAYVPQRDKLAGKPNRAGLVLMTRAANQNGLHTDFVGPVNVQRTDRRDLLLLYMAGNQPFAPLGDEAIAGLRKLLSEGAVLLGESTDTGSGGNEWQAGFFALAQSLGADLKPMDNYAPLLTAHHVFSASPPGASGGKTTFVGDAQMGVLFGNHNWGGLWQGQADPAPSREAIRAAQEWGVNVLVWAGQRRQQIELDRL